MLQIHVSVEASRKIEFFCDFCVVQHGEGREAMVRARLSPIVAAFLLFQTPLGAGCSEKYKVSLYLASFGKTFYSPMLHMTRV